MSGIIPNKEMRTAELKTFIEMIFKCQTKLAPLMNRDRMAAAIALKRGVSEKFYMDFLIAKDMLLNSESDNMTEFEVAFYAKNLSSENSEVRDYAINKLVRYGQNHKSSKAVAE